MKKLIQELIESFEKNDLDKVEDLAYKLIDDNGRCVSLKTRRYLREHDILCVPGERDSYGWLTGVLVYKGKEVIFG